MGKMNRNNSREFGFIPNILGLTAAILFITLFILFFRLGFSEMMDVPEAWIISIISVIAAGAIWFLLERKFSAKEQYSPLKKAISVIGAILAIFLTIFIAMGVPAGFAIGSFDTIEQKRVAVFLISFGILSVVLLFLYPSLSNLIRSAMRRKKPEKKAEAGQSGVAAGGYRGKAVKRIFVALSLIFIVIGSFGLGYFRFYYIQGTILKGSGYNDGPWLTWSDDPTSSICINWLTKDPDDSIVYYGKDPDNLDKVAYGPRNTCVHNVEIKGLEPDTKYYYKITVEFDIEHKSDIFSFTTAPRESRPFKFAVVGDMQPYENSDLLTSCGLVADGLINGSYDFICQVGDIFDSGSNNLDYHLSMLSFSRFAAYTPTQCAIGNHDWSGMSGSVNWGRIFKYNYVYPDTISKFYSFDYLNAHFIMLDNFEAFYSMSKTQLDWLVNDIRDAKARGQDWIFVFFHLTIMTVSTSGWYYNLQKQLIPIFDREGVDAVFYGHDHDYQHYYYEYGWNNLYYDKDHDWEHHPIHYFCTGGGGASLEVRYGNLEPRAEEYTVQWYNASSGDYQTITYVEHNWNASRYLTHDDFTVQYSQYSEDGKYFNKYYYYYPPYEDYSELAEVMGFDYGEQAYHFMQIEIDGKTCTISARYPNGVILSGPGGVDPQIWVLTK